MQEQRAAQRSRAVEGQQALLWQSRGVCRQILSRLPALKDKLSFRATCKAARQASQDSSSWETCELGDLAGNGSAFSAVGRYAPAIRYLTGGTKDQVSAAQWQAAWPFFISLRHLKWSLSAELLEVGVRAAHWRAGL
ncbi:hypothetical protein WJX74_008388 [Apatococcus lobatus]|uniref:F-box protein n=1 Tax=Apatococcus lobatus TaxID=904363 RepID=A0AAW1QCP0_9CHLO